MSSIRDSKITEADLESIFNEAAKGYIENTTAIVVEERLLKVRWARDSTHVVWRICDFLVGCPRHIVEEIARATCERIWNPVEGKIGWSEEVKEYLSSTEFAAMHQSTYIERNMMEKGLDRKFKAYLKRAKASGHEIPEGIVARYWGDEGFSASPTMRVIAIPKHEFKGCSDAVLDVMFEAGVRAIAEGVDRCHTHGKRSPAFVRGTTDKVDDDEWTKLDEAGVRLADIIVTDSKGGDAE